MHIALFVFMIYMLCLTQQHWFSCVFMYSCHSLLLFMHGCHVLQSCVSIVLSTTSSKFKKLLMNVCIGFHCMLLYNRNDLAFVVVTATNHVVFIWFLHISCVLKYKHSSLFCYKPLVFLCFVVCCHNCMLIIHCFHICFIIVFLCFISDFTEVLRSHVFKFMATQCVEHCNSNCLNFKCKF